MQGSRAESIEAWTKHEDDQYSQDSQQYSSKFEKGYRVFQMSSERNQANLQIQKLTIQLQCQKRENRKELERLIRERDDLAVKCEELKGQLTKATTMLEAEKTARKKINSMSKTLQNEVKGVREALGGLDSWEAVSAELLKMKKRITEGEDTIQGLSQNLLDIRAQKDKEIKALKQEAQLALKQVAAAHKDITADYEGQLSNLRSKKNQADILETQRKDLISKLSQIQEELFEKDKLVKCLKMQMARKDEQLKNLRIKQQIWKVTQQKSREDKLRFGEEMHQLQLKFDMSKKKIEQKQQKISELKAKATHVETVVQEKNVLLRKRQEEQILLEEELQLLKKKVHHGEIYKQRYGKMQNTLRELGERAANFESIAQQYAQQIHELQQALQTAHVSQQELQQEIASLRQQTDVKQRQIDTLIHKGTHQCELIKQKNKEIATIMQKLEESNKKVNFLTYSQQSERLSPTLAFQHMLQEMREKISSHYEKLLRDEEANRKKLQEQVSETRKKMFELRTVLSQNQQQLAQIRQEKQLAERENEKMGSMNSQRQQLHEKKIVQLRDRYRQMSRVKSQTYFRGVRAMRIISCYSYSLVNQKERNEYSPSYQRMHEGMDSTVRRVGSPSKSDTYDQY